MKWFVKRLFFSALATLLCLGMSLSALAAETPSETELATAYLREKGIMVGDEHGNMNLDRTLNRLELAAVLARVVANPDHIEADQAFYASQCTFSDVPDWARRYVGYCETNHLLFGYGGGIYGAYDPVTPSAACTVMLRCLEDIDDNWSYDTACQKAVSLDLTPAEAVTAPAITRGDMAVLIYRTMKRMGFDMENSSGSSAISYNADGSINVPSDGSRYIPQAGHVIRCDDGSNYIITDVSRYDQNTFASGPLPELPAPTCDWSLLPQPELPQAETRRFHLESGDYLFVRNLYETRRMLYTLYNAIGDNPETWQNGKPVLHPSGNPKVKINLTIDADVTAEVFWPWRDTEIINPFNSNPCGTHSLEAWDVYKDGIFLRTEYNVHHKT